jgi:hypothetical protein
MQIIDDHDHARTAQALAALEGGEEQARRRVWAKVVRGIAAHRKRRRRRAMLATVAGSYVTVAVMIFARILLG